MGSRQYIIPVDSMTLSDQKEYRMKALAAGILRCYELKVAPWDPGEIPSKNAGRLSMQDVLAFLMGSGWPKNLAVRDFQPILDAGSALDQWNTAPLVAPIGTPYSIFQAIAAPAIGLRATKLVVWYNLAIETVPLPVSRIEFRRTNAAGNIMAQFDMEPLAVQQTMLGYYSEPVVWDPNQAYAIQVLTRIATGVFARVIPGNFLFEPAGQTNV